MAANAIGYGWEPGRYTAFRAGAPIVADGRAASVAWQCAPRTPRFVDMLTGAPGAMGTTAAILWDDEALHIAFWAEEPAPAATMTERDALLFFENDLEVFIDGGDSYYELELNALGTVYEVFYIWRDAHTPGSKWDVPKFGVHNPSVHSFGGDYPREKHNFWTGNHPRGTRWAYLDYDLPGLDVKVRVDGTVNDPKVLSRGWSAEITMPWSGLTDLSNGRPMPPKEGDTWGIFLGRFQQIATRGPANTATAGWAAHPFGVADTHLPECFTQVTFSTQTAG